MTWPPSGRSLPRMIGEPQIVAFGGGGFSMESGNPLLDDYVMGLTRVARPKVCFLPTASGDADHYLVRFYSAFARARQAVAHLVLPPRARPADVRAHLLAQDVIYVGGGSLLSLLGVWRAHGVDEILREAWESGVVMCGLSAGSLCWFSEAVSGYHGEVNRVPGSASCRTRTRSTTARATATPRSTTCWRRDVPRVRGRGRRGAPLRRGRAGRVVSSRPRRAAYRLDAARAVRVVSRRCGANYLGRRVLPVGLQRAGRGRPAGAVLGGGGLTVATQRASRATRRSSSRSSSSPTPTTRASACSRRRAGTCTTRSRTSTRPFGDAAATSRSRCFAWESTASTCAST